MHYESIPCSFIKQQFKCVYIQHSKVSLGNELSFFWPPVTGEQDSGWSPHASVHACTQMFSVLNPFHLHLVWSFDRMSFRFPLHSLIIFTIKSGLLLLLQLIATQLYLELCFDKLRFIWVPFSLYAVWFAQALFLVHRVLHEVGLDFIIFTKHTLAHMVTHLLALLTFLPTVAVLQLLHTSQSHFSNYLLKIKEPIGTGVKRCPTYSKCRINLLPHHTDGTVLNLSSDGVQAEYLHKECFPETTDYFFPNTSNFPFQFALCQFRWQKL